jgi:hypothetical protein
MKKSKKLDVEEFVRVAKELRDQADASEQEFMEHLRVGEESEKMWRPSAATYDRFLKDNHIVDPPRYRNWCRACDLIPVGSIRKIGVHGAIAAARIHDDGARRTAVREMEALRAESGVPMSAQEARHVVSRYQPEKSRALARVSRVQELEALLRERDREIRALKKENAELRAQLHASGKAA